MTRFKLIACGIASVLLLQSCGEILEPVSLFAGKQGVEAESVQEDFEINIKSLTFESARDANNAPYPRRLIQVGIGPEANVIDEAVFLSPSMPPPSKSKDYLLGIGDQLLYTQQNEFVTSTKQFPTQLIEADYLLGVGDELTLIQLNGVADGLESIILSIPKVGGGKDNGNAGKSQFSENILRTSGLVGTDGNILLLGLGSIKAENRSLNDIQTEVRNILIRNGLAPSFQLEITGFNSKKAFVAFPNPDKVLGNNVFSITNLPITLKQLAINYGLRPSSKDTTMVTLTRDDQKFRMTAGQMFDKSFPRILIQDGDQIEIDEVAEGPTSSEAVVGSRGNILLPGIGSIKADNRSLTEVQAGITRVLIEKGLVPNFQLEISDFRSKEFFLVTANGRSKTIALDSSELDLKTAVLSNVDEIVNITQSDNKLTMVKLFRNGLLYRMTLQEMLSGGGSNVFIEDGDTIELKHFNYKSGQVFALSGAGKAKIVPIDPSKRETLADILFTEDGALSNVLARRSEIYLLRGRSPSIAYHLDAQNVSRILVAAKTELRPNDIVFVADRPIISFARTLSELSPLQILIRDIRRDTLLN
jgi:polysaccharide biosynthesis/export protein